MTCPDPPLPTLTTRDCVVDLYADLHALAKKHLARCPPERILQTTGLVHEAYLRLSREGNSVRWATHGEFLGAASETMRRVVVDNLRKRFTQKRGGKFRRQWVDMNQLVMEAAVCESELSEVFRKGFRQLAEEDALTAHFVRLRIVDGHSVRQAGKLMGMSRSSAYEHWDFARRWFRAWAHSMRQDEAPVTAREASQSDPGRR